MEPLNSYHVHHHHHYAADSIKQKDIDKEEDTAEKKMTKPTLSTYIGHDPLDPKSKAHPKKYETNIDAHVAERKEHAAVKRIPDPIERLHLSGPTDLGLKEKLDEAVVEKETKPQESAQKKESL